MKFNLDRDLVFFDIESTGLNVMKDRIVQIALIKYPKGGEEPIEKEMLVNPGIPISEESIAIHGITPDKVSNKPTFIQVADEINDFIGDADLSGYNSDRFDIPMLMEEMARAGIDFDVDNRRAIDVQKIFYKMEPRTLVAALKHFCGKKLEDAHDALADVRATVDVLKGQLIMYQETDYEDSDGYTTKRPIKNDMAAIAKFIGDTRTVDATQRFKYNHQGEIVFNFGKYVGQPAAELLYKDRHYLNWILEKDFSTQVKKIVKKIVREYADKQKQQKS
ncbi:MAG TPA: DNA polymerase III subunit epsilon [Saprospirales bacterium]|nr:3'-5' exonuclease [Saprospiraceae bacterium]HAW03407.1 DNA polymerase III subunit epsilon [Saprospirales bacterium]